MITGYKVIEHLQTRLLSLVLNIRTELKDRIIKEVTEMMQSAQRVRTLLKGR